jgi:LmbE family N-acetylglucosaminyl deacetylase
MADRAGCTVLTALAGSPSGWIGVTGWDAACGFSRGEDVVAARLLEDSAAVASLGAKQRLIGGLDSQYGKQPRRAAIIGDGIETALTELLPTRCLIPLGLQHDDHREVRRAAVRVAANSQAPVEWIVYEDLPYGPDDRRYFHNQYSEEALAAYSSAGFVLSEIELDLGPPDMKADAVERYQSQLRGLRQDPDFDQKIVQERYWALSWR